MTFTAEFLVQILVGLGAGVGAYAAIRYDLGRLHERATMALEAAQGAHRRIDSLQAQR
jgi:hypothetical protein